MEGQLTHSQTSRAVVSFCEEMRATFTGVLPEISVYFEDTEQMSKAIELLIVNSDLSASTMQREGSSMREVVAGRKTPRELAQMVRSGRHLLLKKTFGLPDIGIGVLEETIRIDFRPGPEWSDAQISRLVESLKVLRGKVSVSDICLDEMSEHFSHNGTMGFQELLDGDDE
ncbi:hypothetical protein EBU99_06480 [bacterium]|nr:hypothetical protein [bacterium]